MAAEARARWPGERGAARGGAEGSCRSAAPCGHRVSVREGSGLLLAPPPWLVPLLALARPALRQTGYTAPACTTHSALSCRCGGGRSWGQGRVGSVGLLSALSPSPPPPRLQRGPGDARGPVPAAGGESSARLRSLGSHLSGKTRQKRSILGGTRPPGGQLLACRRRGGGMKPGQGPALGRKPKAGEQYLPEGGSARTPDLAPKTGPGAH